MEDDNHLDAMRKVESLGSAVRTLRTDFEAYRKKSEAADGHMSWAITSLTGKFDSHRKDEKSQYEKQVAMGSALDRKIEATQKAIADLSAELKEPMEVYKAAKYGAKATNAIASLIRWAIPLCVALVVGYNALQSKLFEQMVDAYSAANGQQNTKRQGD